MASGGTIVEAEERRGMGEGREVEEEGAGIEGMNSRSGKRRESSSAKFFSKSGRKKGKEWKSE